MAIDFKLIAPKLVFDPINEEETYIVPVRVIQISDEVGKEFGYIKKTEIHSPLSRRIVFEMYNRHSYIEKFTGFIWEKSYQQLILKSKVSIPFYSMGKFTRNWDGNFKLIVYNQRFIGTIAEYELAKFKTEPEKIEHFVRIYWNFFMWSQINLPDYWGDDI